MQKIFDIVIFPSIRPTTTHVDKYPINDNIHKIVTDDGVRPEDKNALEEKGIEIIIFDKSNPYRPALLETLFLNGINNDGVE